jgi:large repetitive protein
MTALLNRLVLLVASLSAALALLVPAVAGAAGTPNISLDKQAPETALLGSKQKVNLHVTNPAGELRGYNLSFRDVLPVGVKYVAGSAPEAPRIINNAPSLGKTTLIFENVADLSANSDYNLPYEIEAEPTAYTVGGVKGQFENLAEAFVMRPARIKPQFNANGEVVPGTFTGSSEDRATTVLTAIEITKSEPSPEGEILRGLHQHQRVYTLTVQNNDLKPTKEITVEDFLPAGLEYLACDEADNTTNAIGTNAGSKEEYAGSGLINAAGNIPATTNCVKPTEVETEEVDPPGPKPLGIYTHVVWKGIGELAPGAKKEIQYIAAIPIRRNVPFTTPKPSATGLKQVANLDNNTGPETVDEEALTNIARAKGIFVAGPAESEQAPVSDTDEMTRTAEDLAVQKSVDKPTIDEGQISTWTLNIEASEYRYVNNVRVDDVVPNGLCPLGKANYEKTPPTAMTECNPTGKEPSAEYSSVEEQANGTFKVHWDQTTDPQLAQIPPSGTVQIKFPTRTRIFYQKNFENAKPILTRDSWTNTVDIAGEDFAICAPNDPLCTKGQSKIFTQEAEGVDDLDHSEAGQEAGGVTIDKSVRDNTTALVPGDCSGTYVGLTGESPVKVPKYRPGDKVCWQLRVNFASDLYAGAPTVTDFLPPDEKYIVGSAQKTENDSVNATLDESEASGGSLEWTIGESVASGNKIFEWRFMTEMQKPTTSEPEEITGNLMKFTYSNTAGKTFPLRDRVEIERAEPELKLDKRVVSVEGSTAGVNAEGNATGAKGGEKVKYSVAIKNEGNLAAKAVEAWDILPEGLKCESVSAISDGGACAAGTSTIKWSGLALAINETRTFTYEMVLPTNVAPSQEYKNKAGVTQYASVTNKGSTEDFHYYPSENIAGKTFETEHPANVGKIEDEAKVNTAAAVLAKTRVTTVEQLGNNLASEATIGEGVKYTVTATIPAGTELFGSPRITDQLGTRLVLVPGTVKGSVNGVATPTVGVEAAEEAGNPVLKFPATYVNPAGEDDTIKLEFEAKVADVAANNRLTGGTLTNEAKLTFNDQKGAAQTKTATVNTTIVEPVIAVTKTNAGGTVVKPGETIEYTVTASNGTGTRVSTANDTTVVDTVPAGMTPVNETTPIVNGGTVNPDGGVWNEGARTITWTVPTLAPGASKALRYSLLVNKPANAGSTFKNTVVDTTTSLPGAVTGERTSTSLSHVGYEAKAERTVTLNEAELTKEVLAPKGQTIGDPLTYTLKLKLPPQISFFNATVEDQLPKGVVYDKTASILCAPGCGPFAVETATLKPKLEGGSQLLGWYFGTLASAEVERTITIVVNAHIAQKIELNAAGEETGTNVVDKNTLTNKAIGLYNGESKFGTPTEPPARSSFTNKTGEPSAGTEVKEPKLAIKKSVAGSITPTETQPGDPLVYTIEVTNNGDSNAYDTVVEDNNPNPAGGLGTVDPSTGEGSGFLAPLPGRELRWLIPGPIAPGATQKLTYKATLKASGNLTNGETVPNTADIPVYLGAPAAQRSEEGSARFREYKEDPSSTVTLKVALPKLKLEKTTGPNGTDEEFALIGEEFEWRLKAENLSPTASLKGVSFIDTLPEGWEYVAGSSKLEPSGTSPTPTATVNGEGKEELVWATAANIGPSASATLTFKAIPTTALVGKEGVFTNNAMATGKDLSGSETNGEGPYASTDTAKANLQTPPLTIVKKPDAGDAAAKAVAGKTSAYTIEVVNGGEATATGVKVTDLMDLGNEYTSGATAAPPTGFAEVGTPEVVEPTPGVQKRQVKWEIASIPAKGKVLITVPVSLSPTLPDPTVLHDVASVESKQQPVPVSDEGTLEVEREAKLTIQKTAITPTAVAGEGFEYKVSVKNTGPSEAANVVVRDPIPAGMKFITADSPCKEATGGGEVICELGDLKLNETVEKDISFEILAATVGQITNKAKVESPDDPSSPHEAEVTTTVEPEAQLSIVKEGPAQPVLLGSTFDYKIEVENKGPSDATEVEVNDPLPPQVALVSAEAPCAEGNPEEVLCKLGTLVPHEKRTLHFTVKAIELAEEGENVVNVATVSSETPPAPGSIVESKVETTVLPAADLAIAKTAPATVAPNGELTYKLHVENLGPSIAHKVTVTDPLPAGVDFVSASAGCSFAAGTVTCAVQAPEGEVLVENEAKENAVDFEVTVHVPYALGGQPLANTATVKGEEADPNTENDQSTVTTTVGPAADLAIAKTMGKAEAGKPLTYTLAVTNKGPSTASAVTVKDTLPAGTTFKSAAPSQGTCSASGQDVTCQLGPLASGGSAQVSITVDVGSTVAGNIRNTATVEGPEPDPDKGNNESSVEGPVTPLPPATPAATGTPNLKVVKTASTSTPQVGTPFNYTVTVSNIGNADAKNVKVIDTLNGPVKVISIEAGSGKCSANGSKIECQIPTIAVGKSVRITYSVVAESAGELSNTASAMPSNGEKAPANNHAVKSVKAQSGKAHFTLTKTAAKKVVGGGKKVAFTITLRNGPVALVNATVCDRLPAALVFVRAAGAGFVKGEACWQKKFVAAGKTLKLHLTARAVRGYKPRKATNVASASAENAPKKQSAKATVRVKPAFAGAPGGVTG